MASRDPLIGQQLANYRIEKLIGRGGMAKVYLGWDIRLRRSVAVKVIDDRFQDDPNYTKRFLREARTMATWQNMNIPLVYHVGEENDILFFAMEYIHGQNLSHLLAQHSVHGELLPIAEVLRIGWAIAKALDFAHEKGVIHRDVNPSNVILADDGRVMLMDFGLALDLIQGTQGEVFGTPGYIAPEQARNSAQAVSQTDLYSLGVMLYEMLIGTTPFDDPSPIALALKHITDQPLPPSKTNPDINAEMDAVLMKALHKNPPERFQSGQALMEALEMAIHWTGSESPLPTLAELPGMPDTKPTHTLAEIPAGKSLNLQDEAQTPAIESPVQERAKPVSWTSRTLVIGGLGCGLIVLIGLVLLVGELSASWLRGNAPTEFSLADLLTQTALSTLPTSPNSTNSPPPTEVSLTPIQTTTLTSPPAPTVTPTFDDGTTQVADMDGMVMVLIPAGEFQMGCDPVHNGGFECPENELPAHLVTLADFWMDQTEVTNAKYALCVQDGACQPPRQSDSHIHADYWDNPDFQAYPVVHVTWNDATAYCTWAGRRLPTEAEWEKAARGGLQGMAFSWGDAFEEDQANFCDRNCAFENPNPNYDDGTAEIAPVGSYPANAYGLYDIAGNVWEWVIDWYDPDYYRRSPYEDPQGPASGIYRVLRGGGWNFDRYSLRVADRIGEQPTSHYPNSGFRCVGTP